MDRMARTMGGWASTDCVMLFDGELELYSAWDCGGHFKLDSR